MQLPERRIDVVSGDLRLEAALHEGDGALSALVLHPHPMYGGDMDNHVVLAVCQALAGEHATTLRFNFRGTGRSQGSFDGKAAKLMTRSPLRLPCARSIPVPPLRWLDTRSAPRSQPLLRPGWRRRCFC